MNKDAELKKMQQLQTHINNGGQLTEEEDKYVKKWINKQQKEQEEEQQQTSLYINEEQGIIAEQVYDEKELKSQFCVYNTKTGEIKYQNEIAGFKPINAEEVTKKAVLLPNKAEEYGTDQQLDEDIKKFIHKWLDIPQDVEQFTLWNIKRSWVFERFHTLNYSRALGDAGLGKTRFLDTLGSIHYKPIFTSGATTSAPVFRVIDKWRGTMIFDEADLKNSDETEVIIKIINLGYERGKFIMRCDQNDAEKIRFFDPYCPKIIATRQPFEDKAVESRCITQVMTGTNRKDIPRNLNDIFFTEAQMLRNKLLMWRFKNYYKIKPDITPDFDFGDLEPRVEQIVTSFITLFSEDAKQMEIFKKFVLKHQEQLIQERQSTWEGSIIIAIHDLIEEGKGDISYKDIVEKAGLTDRKGNQLSPRALSKPLKSLGFEQPIPTRIGDKTKKILALNQEHLDTLFKRYGVTVVTVVTIPASSKKNGYANLGNEENGDIPRADRNDSNNRNMVTDFFEEEEVKDE